MLLPQALKENRATLALATPMIAGQVGQMLMGWADSVMVGRIGVVPLAACAFANTVVAVFILFAFGLMSGVTVRASHAFGSGVSAAPVFRAGLWLALLSGSAVAGGVIALLPALGLLGQPEEVVRESRVYLALVAVSMIPMLLATSAKNFSEALSKPWPPFWILMAGVALNVFLNWVFIFGHLGSPALGLAGAGVATLLSRIAVAAGLVGYVARARAYRGQIPDRWFAGLRPGDLRELLKIGVPAGGQLLAEVSAFAFASLMMGWISVGALAAHQIAITCAATTFMVPLGLGMAACVRIGQSAGAGRTGSIRPITGGALLMTSGAMVLTAACFLLFGRQISQIFIADPEVVALSAALLFVAGVFQIFDGAQVVLINALRGMADVRVPFLIAVGSYWVFAVPASWVLAFPGGWGAPGIWAGLAVGLVVACGLLGWRFVRVTGRFARGAAASV